MPFTYFCMLAHLYSKWLFHWCITKINILLPWINFPHCLDKAALQFCKHLKTKKYKNLELGKKFWNISNRPKYQKTSTYHSRHRNPDVLHLRKQGSSLQPPALRLRQTIPACWILVCVRSGISRWLRCETPTTSSPPPHHLRLRWLQTALRASGVTLERGAFHYLQTSTILLWKARGKHGNKLPFSNITILYTKFLW